MLKVIFWFALKRSACLFILAPIWRRIPAQAVPNRYHHESEYERAAKEAGFVIKEAVRSHFANENEREAHNLASTGKLGAEYVERNAFLVLVLEKS
jgi:hypothetical protein